MKFTKRELELQQQETLEKYIERVSTEARRRLIEKHNVKQIYTAHLRSIKSMGHFEDDVETVVCESIYYS